MSDQQSKKNSISRKNFLVKLSLSLAGLNTVMASIPVLSALLAPLLEAENPQWRTVGTLADFPEGTTKLVSFVNADPKPYAGVTAKTAAWLRHNEKNDFTAFAVNCTHLGCPVRWEDKAQLFMCPCHGGVYYKDGTVAAGPPPTPLTKIEVRINKTDVEIKTAPVPITTITE